MDESSFSSPKKLATFLLETSNELAELFQTLSNQKRVQILANLVFEKQSLADLQSQTGFQPSLLGNHLSMLLETGLIKKLGRGSYDISHDGYDLLQKISEVFLELKIREQQRLQYLQAIIGRYVEAKEFIHRGSNMTKIKDDFMVQIVELPPFDYISFHSLGTQPEGDAFSKLEEWLTEQKYLEDMAQHPIYGFNNPDPQKDKPEYGYEVWVKVNRDEVKDDREVHHFGGGRYAVTTTKLFPLNPDNVIPAWPRLVKWADENGYQCATHQWLEKALTPFETEDKAYLDLYLPIE